MFSFLLVVIYAAFISLGLPDSLTGSAWPVMHTELSIPLSYAGIITMLIAGGTIASSLLSNRLTRRFGAGHVTAASVFMTAAALFGFSISKSFFFLCIWAVPYGLGAGAVDAALNHYVAVHFASRHMSWLHSFWGLGAGVSPYIMSACLSGGYGWRAGYRTVSMIQIGLTVLLFVSLPLWNKRKAEGRKETKEKDLSILGTVKLRGVPLVLAAFFAYCALEQTAGLWASSYLVQHRGIPVETAARFASLYYLGIMFGRFACGFITEKIGDKKLIRIGILVTAAGIFFVLLPVRFDFFALFGLAAAGLGSAPVYPSIIHSTPVHFGEENSQAVIGVQMASAYVGTTFMPPFFGFLAERLGISLYPFYLMVFALLMLWMTEKLNSFMKKRRDSI